MPLRVAEKDGYIYAVNKCADCPYVKIVGGGKVGGKPVDGCRHPGSKKEQKVFFYNIPVWCPLPTPSVDIRPYIGIDMGDKKGDRTATQKAEDIREEVIPFQPILIVDDPGPPGYIAKEITVRSEHPGGPGFEYLRKDDCFVFDGSPTGEAYWICETPTSHKVKITPGPDLKKGDRLVAMGPVRGREI